MLQPRVRGVFCTAILSPHIKAQPVVMTVPRLAGPLQITVFTAHNTHFPPANND